MLLLRAAVRPMLPMLAGLGLTTQAAADGPDVYGRINLTLQNSDEASEEQVELRNNASRIGVKGDLQLTPGLKAIYQLEFGVNIDDDEDTFTHRNQFVGLEGAFGTIKAGRHDTALKEAQGDFDLFDDLEGDIAGVVNGENRLRNYLGYTTPKFADAIQVRVNFFPGEDPENGEDGFADGTSVSIDYSTDSLYLALAHDSDLDGEDVKTLRVIGGHSWDAVQVMLLYQRTDVGGAEHDGFGASLAWELGQYTAKFQYIEGDQWRSGLPADPLDDWYESLWSVGLDRAFGEDTRLFAFFTGGEVGRTGEQNRYVAVGIEHDF